jgi:Family of unknown function (DUF6491)
MRHNLRALAPPAALLSLLSLLGGCALNPPHPGTVAAAATSSQEQALARYRAYAGPPIDRFTWLGHFYSWEQLGRDQLVVFTTPSDAYLLKVWPSCDLRFVINTIGVTSTGGTVSARLDSVKIDSAPTGRMVCPIEEIRSIDYGRMTADMRAKAQQSAAAPQSPR